MKRTLTTIIAVALVLSACSDGVSTDTTDGTDTSETPTSEAPQLTADEREWCALGDASDTTAFRFDQIFESGLSLSLPMDALNAQASVLRTTYEGEGMSPDEAIIAVFRDLIQEPVFIQACKQAYFDYVLNR